MQFSHTIAILAYNNHELTYQNIKHLCSLGYTKNILLFDNGSDPSIENIANKFGIRYHRERLNIYVNPAWNYIFTMEDCHYLTLLNNDCFILTPSYFEDILPHMEKNKFGISSCKTRNIACLKNSNFKSNDYFYFPNEVKTLIYNNHARRQGWLMTMNLKIYKKMEYLIPNYLKIWYGDDWIWSQFIKNNIKTAVYKNRYAVHIKSSSISSKALQEIVKTDNNNLDKYGDWHREMSPLLHKRTRLFSRYV